MELFFFYLGSLRMFFFLPFFIIDSLSFSLCVSVELFSTLAFGSNFFFSFQQIDLIDGEEKGVAHRLRVTSFDRINQLNQIFFFTKLVACSTVSWIDPRHQLSFVLLMEEGGKWQ